MTLKSPSQIVQCSGLTMSKVVVVVKKRCILSLPLSPVHLQIDTEASACIEMTYCRISNFPPQTTVLVVYRSPNSTTSENLLGIQVIRRAATAPEVCLIVGDFNAPAVGDKNLLTNAEEEFLYQSITQPIRFLMENQPLVLDLVLTKFPDTISTIRLLPALGNRHHAR